MLLNPAAILAKTHRKWTQVLWPRSPIGHVWNLIGNLQRKQEKESSSNSSLQKQQQTLAMQLVLFTWDQNTPNRIHETLVHKPRNIMRVLRSNFPAFSSSITQQPLKKPKDCLMACDIVAWLETDTETQRHRDRGSSLPIAAEASVQGAMSSKMAWASTAMAGTYAPHQLSCSKEQYIPTFADFPELVSLRPICPHAKDSWSSCSAFFTQRSLVIRLNILDQGNSPFDSRRRSLVRRTETDDNPRRR
jgi:hypothetical protein